MDLDKISEVFFGKNVSKEHDDAASVKFWVYETDIYLAMHCPKAYVKWNEKPEVLEMVK